MYLSVLRFVTHRYHLDRCRAVLVRLEWPATHGRQWPVHLGHGVNVVGEWQGRTVCNAGVLNARPESGCTSGYGSRGVLVLFRGSWGRRRRRRHARLCFDFWQVPAAGGASPTGAWIGSDEGRRRGNSSLRSSRAGICRRATTALSGTSRQGGRGRQRRQRWRHRAERPPTRAA